MNSSLLIQFIGIVAITFAIIDAAKLPRSSKKNSTAGSNGTTTENYLVQEWVTINTKNSSHVQIPLGGALELACEAIGHPPPTIKWLHNNVSIYETGFPEKNEVIYTAIGKLRSRILIDCVTASHAGEYRCSGTSAHSTSYSDPVVVKIEGSTTEQPILPNSVCEQKFTVPRVTTWVPTLLEYMDLDVVIPCIAYGNPMPEIYWLTNDQTRINTNSTSTRYKVFPNGDLMIMKLVWADMGTYSCVARNSVGQEDRVNTFVYPLKRNEGE